MTAITAANARTSSFLAAAPVALSVSAVPASASPAFRPTALQPVITSSFSALASSTAVAGSNAANVQPPLISATTDQASHTLEALRDAGFVMFNYNHVNWNTIYQMGGEQGVKNLQASFIKELNGDRGFNSETHKS